MSACSDQVQNIDQINLLMGKYVNYDVKQIILFEMFYNIAYLDFKLSREIRMN